MQEMFIQYLAEQGHNVVKSERKPRKNIQYKDLGTSRRQKSSLVDLTSSTANAVARIDNLEFLSDVIPRTVPYKQLKEGSKKARDGARNDSVERGQTTIDGNRRDANGANGESAANDDYDEEEEANAQLLGGQRVDVEIRGGRSNGVSHSSGEHINGVIGSDEDSTME